MTNQASNARARTAGRGGVAVLGAKAFFIVSGLVQQTLLPRFIGLAGYGALSRVLAVANVLNNVVVASSVQGVSRAVARAQGAHDAGGDDGPAFRATLRVHAPIALVAGALFALAAPAIAAFEGAPHIAGPLAAVAGVVTCYGLYAPLVGALNGRNQFVTQARLDVTFAVLRTAGLIGVGWFFVRSGGSGVLGAAIGFVLAAALIIPMALRATGLGRQGDPGEALGSVARYLRELWPLAIAQLFTNMVMQVDITLLGRFLSQGAVGAIGAVGAVGAVATHVASGKLAASTPEGWADEWVGVYRACQLFAFLPYQLLFSVTQVLFPMVARAAAERDHAAVRTYVERGARLGALACGLMVSVIVAMPGSLLAFAYGEDVASRGAAALRILALGQGAFALLGIASTVLASLGRERVAAIISLASLALVTVACVVVVPQRPFGEAQLVSTALSTTAALVLALALAAQQVRSAAGGFIPLGTLARVGAALAIAVVAGPFLPQVGRLVTPVLAALVGAAYVAFLVITREIGNSDVAALRAIAGRSK